MATKVINVTVGATVNGSVLMSHGSHAGSASGNASFTYDDTVVTGLAQAKSALDEVWAQLQSNKDLKH